MLLALTFSSCGPESAARSHVRSFMEKEMGLNDYDVIAWSNVDSAFHVSDSMLTVMRDQAAREKTVKGKPAYAQRTAKLHIITVKYSVGKDTLMNTFYLDDKLQGIVGVKKDAVYKAW